MAGGTTGAIVRQFERLFTTGAVSGLTEGQLLDRFVTRNDEAAFEALLCRHGPMVLGVCRRLLRDPNDVDDAFQATFLVLVRKAGSLRRGDLLGNWLYGVAYRVAVRARAVSARRVGTERPSVESLATTPGPPDPMPEVFEEVLRLPERYRSVVVLCDLEGLTHDKAAARLGCPIGTVKGRLSRARDLLRSRLTRRGLTLASSAAVADLLARDAPAAVPPSLVGTTVAASALAASGTITASGLISAQAVLLTEGVLYAMSIARFKTIAVTLVVGASVLTGAGVLARGPSADPARGVPDDPKPKPKPKAAAGGSDTARTSPPPKPGPRGPEAGPSAVPKIGPVSAPLGFGGMQGMQSGPFAALQSKQQMRVAIADLVNQVASHDRSPKTRAILKKLDEPVNLSFPTSTPLDDVLKYIQGATEGPNDVGIPIYVDPVALNEHVERASNNRMMTNPSKEKPSEEQKRVEFTSVKLDLEGVPLKTSLRLLLKQLDLAYCVVDGVLIISSVEGVYSELKEAESTQAGEEDRRTPRPDGGF